MKQRAQPFRDAPLTWWICDVCKVAKCYFHTDAKQMRDDGVILRKAFVQRHAH